MENEKAPGFSPELFIFISIINVYLCRGVKNVILDTFLPRFQKGEILKQFQKIL